jgi:molybdopterin-guanine dinucleotide biosynthesis protein A
MTFSAAILAGGRANRLGGVDKSALVVDGRSILERQLAALMELPTDLLIVANDLARYGHTGVMVSPDEIPGAGALGGLYTALVRATTDHVLVIPCDMPFLTSAFLRAMVEQSADVEAVVPRDKGGRHPLCAVYATSVAPHLKACIDAGRLRVEAALDGLVVREIGPDQIARYDTDGRLLLNVNTPDDFARATGG